MDAFDELAAGAPEWYADVISALRRDKKDEAMRIARSNLAKSSETNNQSGKMMALRGLVKGYIAKGDAYKGEQSAKDALEIAKSLKDKKAKASAVLLLAKVYVKQTDVKGNMEKAETQAQEARNMFNSLKFPQGEAAALNSLAITKMEDNRLDEAFDLSTQAIELFKSCNEKEGQVSALNTTCRIKYCEDRLFQALCIAKEMADLYAELQDRRGEGTAHLLEAETHLKQDSYKEALSSANEAARCFDEVGDNKLKGAAVQAMARAFAGAGQHADAAQTAQAALDHALVTRNKRGQADALTTLALALVGQGQHAKALEHFMDAASLLGKLKDKQGEATVLGKMAQSQIKVASEEGANWSKKQRDEAIQRGEATVAKFVDLGPKYVASEGYGYGLLALAKMLFYAKAFEQVTARAEEAQQLFSECGDLSGDAQAQLLLAQVQLQEDKANLPAVIDMAKKAQEIAEDAFDSTTKNEIRAFLKALGQTTKQKPSNGGTIPVDIEYLHQTVKMMEVESYQGRSTTAATVQHSSSKKAALMVSDGGEDYNPASQRTPIKEQVLYTLRWHKMPRGDRTKLVLPESQRPAIAA